MPRAQPPERARRRHRHRFRIASNRDAVAPAVERILDVVRDVGLNADRQADLAVAITEALSNAAVHGNRLKPSRRVQVDVVVTPRDSAVIEIKDSGAGFDLEAVADPTDPKHLLDADGRGIFLMRRLVDSLEYLDHGSRVRLTMERRQLHRRSRKP